VIFDKNWRKRRVEEKLAYYRGRKAFLERLADCMKGLTVYDKAHLIKWSGEIAKLEVRLEYLRGKKF
jgi:hypothetical protein